MQGLLLYFDSQSISLRTIKRARVNWINMHANLTFVFGFRVNKPSHNIQSLCIKLPPSHTIDSQVQIKRNAVLLKSYTKKQKNT